MGNLDIYRIIQEIALIAPGFLLAITVHEFTHGYIAYKFGDPTAKLAGRLTFNPISHLDPIGTIMLVLDTDDRMGEAGACGSTLFEESPHRTCFGSVWEGLRLTSLPRQY